MKFGRNVMTNCKKLFSTIVLTIAVLMNPFPAFAAEEADAQETHTGKSPDGAEMIVDFVIARPIGIVATVLGTVFFVISWPFSALGGNSDEAWESMVVAPAEYTFSRPLGDFDQ